MPFRITAQSKQATQIDKLSFNVATRNNRPTLTALAKSTGVTVVSLRNWQKEGVDVFDPGALSDRVARMHGGPGGEAMKRERLRKLKADASLAELELSKRRNDVIDADKVHGLFMGLVQTAMFVFKAMPRELPAILDGMPPSQMSEMLMDYRDALINRMREEMETVFRDLGMTNESNTSDKP